MLQRVLQRAGSAAWSSGASACSSGTQLEAVARQLLPAARGVSWAPQRGFGSSADDEEREITDPVVLAMADKILELNLLQVSDLTDILRKRLGIPMGMSMGMPMGGMPMAAAAAPAAAEAAPAAAPVEEKTEWTLKLDGYDAASKIKVIKEVRAITGLGLKEAKELVEGSPKVVKDGLKKEEAEALQKTLTEAGAKVSLD